MALGFAVETAVGAGDASRVMGSGSVLRWVGVGVTFGMGCYGHVPPAGPSPMVKIRPEWVGGGSGVYRIERDDELVGEETFSIRADVGVWRVDGVVRWEGVLAHSEGYWLEFDAATAEPRALGLFLELVGQRRTLEARVHGGYLDSTAEGPGGSVERSIPYAPGTNVEFSSPLFKAPLMSLLGPELVSGKPVFVRTIVFEPPEFSVHVELLRLLQQGERRSDRLVVLERRGQPVPAALWVRPDGLVSRMRTWPGGVTGPRLEWKLIGWKPSQSTPP